MSCSATSAAHDKRKEAPSTARPGHRGPAVVLPSANWTGHWSAARAAAASRARFLFVDALLRLVFGHVDGHVGNHAARAGDFIALDRLLLGADIVAVGRVPAVFGDLEHAAGGLTELRLLRPLAETAAADHDIAGPLV